MRLKWTSWAGPCSYAPYSHHFKAAPVLPQDVVTTFPNCSALSLLHPCLQVPVPPELTEVVEEVHHTKLHQQVSNLLVTRVLGFSNVRYEVTYHYRILAPEVCEGLLQVW